METVLPKFPLWLRISMRLLKVNPTLAQQEAKAAYEAGVMTSNSDICYVAHESSRLDEGPGNGFANQMLEDPTYSNYRMTNELLEALTSTNDPRTLYIGGAYYTDSKRTDITSIVYGKNRFVSRSTGTRFHLQCLGTGSYHQYRWKRCKCSTPLPEDATL